MFTACVAMLLLCVAAGAWHAAAVVHALCAGCAQHHGRAWGLHTFHASIWGQPPGEAASEGCVWVRVLTGWVGL